MSVDRNQFAAEIKNRARGLGFDRAGIAPARPSDYRDYLRQWLDDGNGGTMDWLANRFDERVDVTKYLPGAASVICVAINYHTTLAPAPVDESPERAGVYGRIARYALGDDYHELIKYRLHALADWMRQLAPESQTRACVDTAPVLEKEQAARAGVGWIGKNTCLIDPQIGSWLLLGEIVTTLALPSDRPAVDRCGTCTRCIDACPTHAITAPYQLDARRCISYLTIEHRGPVAPELQNAISPWLFGCDICQDVCPWNRKAPDTPEPAFKPRWPDGRIDLREVLSWAPADYASRLRGSAMKRVKLPVLQQNARVIGKIT